LGATLAFSTAASAAIPPAEVDTEDQRYSGDNRYATAAAVAAELNGGCEDYVVVNGSNWPDGLAASVLGEPILLVEADSIPADTAAFISAVEAGDAPFEAVDDVCDITIIGGTSAVSNSVSGELSILQNAVNPTDSVLRIGGANRYETALAVAEFFLDGSTPTDLILATGQNYPDALSAGVLAQELDAPILLNDGGSLRADVKALIGDMGLGGTVHIIGGESAVPASIASELLSMGVTVNRLGGADRAATAAAVAAYLAVEQGYGDGSIMLVNGNGFADALAAAPLAHDLGAVMLLTNATSIPAATAGYHVATCAFVSDIYAVGGTAVIADAIIEAAAGAATCVPIDITSATLAVSDLKSQVCDVDQTGGGAVWGVSYPAPTLTAVPGSAASGLAPTVDDVTITAGDPAVGPTASVTGGGVLEVTLGTADLAVSQASFISIWNSLPAAAALFTPAGSSDGLNPPADASTAVIDVACSTPTVDAVFTVTFNKPVGDNTTFGTTPLASDFGFAAITSMTPNQGAAAADGTTVFTFTWNDADAATAGGEGILGATFTLGVGSVDDVNTTPNAEITVPITAG
jgi:putative cell wall-binding protein